jgi:hypothetical protein
MRRDEVRPECGELLRDADGVKTRQAGEGAGAFVTVVEDWGIEPQTLGLQSRCSPAELIPQLGAA